MIDATHRVERAVANARGILLCVLGILLICLALVAGLPSCSQRRVEETVTVDASRASSATANAPPLAVTPQLPARDTDVEQAGDRIAEAITRLKKRQNGAALSALAKSETAITRALGDESRDEASREALRSTLRGLDAAERAIQRGSPLEAAAQLVLLNKKVDSIGINQPTRERSQP